MPGFVCLLVSLALGACANTSPAPTANQQTHVATVEVINHNPAAAAFAANLREAVIREAALYGNTGRPIKLRIELTRLHFKNPLQALVIGDNNQAKGQVAVVDAATGRQTSIFSVQVGAEQGSHVGSTIAMTLDPTGLVAIGCAVSGNRSKDAAAMCANFAAETLRQTYGDARAKAVAKERESRAKT
jgi:hypothetical protein